MTKYQIELSDALARALSSPQGSVNDGGIREDVIAENVERIIAETVYRDRSADPAMAILKDQAMEQAVRCAAPGESDWTLASRAETILNFKLGRM